jgi:Na+/H+ antiporter NhaA
VGIALGLLVGKSVRLAPSPEGARAGFADDPQFLEKAKLGILVGSALSAAVGYLLFRGFSRP